MLFDRGVLIYNPTAGGGATAAGVDAACETLRKHVRKIEKARTEKPHHASALARTAQESGADLVIACGGDGTVNEVVQGLAPKCEASLLVLPGGTANVLSMEVGLPGNPWRAAALLPVLQEQEAPLGRVDFLESGGKRYFLLMCGAGVDAEVADGIDLRMKNRVGEGAYWLSGLQRMFRPFPRLRTVGGGPRKPRSFVLVSKSRKYGGGLVLTPRANLLADRFEVAEFSGANCLPYFSHMLGVALGAAARWPGIEHYFADDVRLESGNGSAVKVQVDGEVAGALPVRVTMCAQALKILLPAGYGVTPLGVSARAAMPAHG